MTTPKPQEKPTDFNRCGMPLSPSNNWNQLEPRPTTDWLAVLGIGSAVVAFLLWAWPA
jgi:hypothetical protein